MNAALIHCPVTEIIEPPAIEQMDFPPQSLLVLGVKASA